MVEFLWFPDPTAFLLPLWKDYRAATKNCFLWQVVYGVPATNHGRFPLAGQTQPETWCTQCPDQTLEDLMHCFWRCPETQEV